MRSAPVSDLTARARIRDAALAALASDEGTSVRSVAEAAGVSAGLVIHHFGTRAGLIQAVDDHVVGLLGGILDELIGGADLAESSATQAILERLGTGSAVPAYLARRLVLGGPASQRLFNQLVGASAELISRLEGAGLMRPAPDPMVRCLFLLVNDLGLLLLRERVAAALGSDPLGPEGMSRWATEAFDVYSHGVMTAART